MIRSLINLILDIIGYLFDLLKSVTQRVLDKFFEINMFEKAIVIMALPSLFAVVLPVARYMIFDEYYTLNNPMAVHMIGIVMLMTVTVYFNNLISLVARLTYNTYYLVWIIYMGATHSISKAPYELMPAYYLSIVIPIIYIACASISYFLYRE